MAHIETGTTHHGEEMDQPPLTPNKARELRLTGNNVEIDLP